MAHERERLDRIFRRTDGRCHLCGRKLEAGDYGNRHSDCGWEVDHSRPRAKGGSDHLNNLYPSHRRCNRSKGTRPARECRAEQGRSAPPVSRDRVRAAKRRGALGGSMIGGVGGFLLTGPAGGTIGTIVGGLLGACRDPNGD
jgi:hypothetical protein